MVCVRGNNYYKYILPPAVFSEIEMLPDNPFKEGRIPVELFCIAPLLALSASLTVSLVSGVLFLMLLVITGVSVSVIRKLIPYQIRIPVLTLIIATWTTIFEILLKVYFHGLYGEMGIYMPLLALNSLVFACAEGTFLTSNLTDTTRYALRTGIVILLLFTGLGTLRELLGHGGLVMDIELIKAGSGIKLEILDPDSNNGLSLVSTPAGAFICCGLILAFWKYLTIRRI